MCHLMSPLEAARGGLGEGSGAANDEKEPNGTIEEHMRFVNVLNVVQAVLRSSEATGLEMGGFTLSRWERVAKAWQLAA